MTPRGTIRRGSDAPAVVSQIDNLAASCRAGVARDLRSRGPEGTRHSRLLLRGRGRAQRQRRPGGRVGEWLSRKPSRGWTVVAVFADTTAGEPTAQPGAHRLVDSTPFDGGRLPSELGGRHAAWNRCAYRGDRRTGDASVRRTQRAGRSESGDALGSMSAARGSRGPRGESPRKRDACIATISVVSRV